MPNRQINQENMDVLYSIVIIIENRIKSLETLDIIRALKLHLILRVHHPVVPVHFGGIFVIIVIDKLTNSVL